MAGLACSLGHEHRPRNLTVELHHVVPVGWQKTWQPQSAPYPGYDHDGRGKLWDARTVALCPTSHRNTHAWIVRLMRGAKPDKRSNECGIALLALEHFTDAGGDLDVLRKAGEWGAV